MRILELNDIKQNVALICNKQLSQTRRVSDKKVYVCYPIKNINSGKVYRTFIVKAEIVYITNVEDESQGTYQWREIEKLNYNDSTKILAGEKGCQAVTDKLFNNLCICIAKTWNEKTCNTWPDKFAPFVPTYDKDEYIFDSLTEAEQFINDCINGKIECKTSNNLIQYDTNE